MYLSRKRNEIAVCNRGNVIPSKRKWRGNPMNALQGYNMQSDCRVATLLAMTISE